MSRILNAAGIAGLFALAIMLGVRVAAAQSPAFEDVAGPAGIVGPEISGAEIGATAGVSFFDFTQDGWDDLTFVLKSGVVRLLENNRDGTFSVFTPPGSAGNGGATGGSGGGDGDASSTGGELEAGGTWGAPVWFDANGDAWPDLLVGGTKTALFLGAENGQLVDATEAAGLLIAVPVVTAAIADMDLDGANDLFLAVDNGPDMLFRFVEMAGSPLPDKDIQVPLFENVAAARGVVDPPGSQPMQSVFVDLDLDGDMDLYSLYDGQTKSRLFINDGTGHFTEQAALWGLDDIGPGNSMGVTVADVNRDGYPDFYVSRIGTGGLFVSQAPGGNARGGSQDGGSQDDGSQGGGGQGGGGQGGSQTAQNVVVSYAEVAADWGVARNGMSWGTVFLDADLNGDEDLAVVHSSSFNGTPALFFERTGPFTFQERGASVGFGFMAENQGLAVGDFDQDSWPDLIIPATTGAHRLLRNISSEGYPSTVRGLAVRLRGPPGNRTSIGARVTLAGPPLSGLTSGTQTRYVLGGESFMSQSGTIVLPFVEGELSVEWPDGVRAERTLSANDFLFGDAADGRVDMVHASVTHIATRPTPDNPTPTATTPRLLIWPNPAPSGTPRPFQVMWSDATATRGAGAHSAAGDARARSAAGGSTSYELYDIGGRRIHPDSPLAPGVYLVRAALPRGDRRGPGTVDTRFIVVQ